MTWLLSLFTGGASSILTYVLGGVAVVAVVGGIYFWVDSRLETDAAQIAALKTANVTLQANVDALNDVIQGKDGQIKDLQQNIEQISQEDAALKAADEQASTNTTQQSAADQKDVQILVDAKTPAAVTAAITTFNAQSDCFVQHFSDFSGSCVDGKWVADKSS